MADELNNKLIGKGNPPKASQYKPGQSGNRKGRPRGRKNMKSIVQRVAHKEHTVQLDGETHSLTTVGLIFRRLQERALQGSPEAIKFLSQLREKYQPDEPEVSVQGILIPPTLSLEDFEKQAEALRAKHAWVQANREQVWAELGLSDGTPKPGDDKSDAT